MSRTDVPPLGYGAANVGNLFRALTDDEAWAVLDAAWESGIRYYDTAPHYGLGLSERRLGAFLQTKPRDEFFLSTKAGRLLRPNPDFAGGLDTDNDFYVPDDLHRVWDFSDAGIRASLDESRERLGLDRIDLVYLHDPERHDLERALDSAFPALEQLRSEGEIGAIGVGGAGFGAMEIGEQPGQPGIVRREGVTAAQTGERGEFVLGGGRRSLTQQAGNRAHQRTQHARFARVELRPQLETAQ